MGRRFGQVVDLFSWGGPGCVLLRGFSQDERAPNRPVCVIDYMLSSGGFTATCLQAIAKGGSSILGRPGPTDSTELWV
jgi:hypothetical protein